MLPGIGSPGLLFAANTASLSQHFQTFAVDNIHDFGRSVETRPVTGADDFTSWLDEVCTGLKLGDAVNVLGLSYGGWIAAKYALRYPDRVRRLVLLAPAGTLQAVPWGFIWRGILCMIPVRVFMNNLVSWMAGADSGEPDSRRLLSQMADDTFVAQRSFKLRRMVPPVPLTDEQLGNLPATTLILFGDREVVFDPHKALSRLHSAAPQVRTDLIKDVGHGFFISCAEEVNQRIINFLKTV
jgi:pimeloyl-ACP methyl ester carboxylesterase